MSRLPVPSPCPCPCPCHPRARVLHDEVEVWSGLPRELDATTAIQAEMSPGSAGGCEASGASMVAALASATTEFRDSSSARSATMSPSLADHCSAYATRSTPRCPRPGPAWPAPRRHVGAALTQSRRDHVEQREVLGAHGPQSTKGSARAQIPCCQGEPAQRGLGVRERLCVGHRGPPLSSVDRTTSPDSAASRSRMSCVEKRSR